MMRQTGHFRFVRENGVAAIELPYADDDLSMIAILPDGDIEKMGQSLSIETIQQLCVDMYSEEVDVFLPRFKLELVSCWRNTPAMGMPDPSAKSSRISPA